MKKDEERERERILDSPEQLVCVDITRLMHPTAYCAAIPRKVSICKEKHSAWQLQTSGCGSIILYRNNRGGEETLARCPGHCIFDCGKTHTHPPTQQRETESLTKRIAATAVDFLPFCAVRTAFPTGAPQWSSRGLTTVATAVKSSHVRHEQRKALETAYRAALE